MVLKKLVFGYKVLVFCYPFGRGDSEVVSMGFRCLGAWLLVLEAF